MVSWFWLVINATNLKVGQKGGNTLNSVYLSFLGLELLSAERKLNS